MPDMTKYIEPRISLTWLLSVGGSWAILLAVGIWNLSAANAQMARVADAVTRLEARLDQRDARLDRIAADLQTMRSVDEVQSTRLTHVEEEVRRLTGVMANRRPQK